MMAWSDPGAEAHYRMLRHPEGRMIMSIGPSEMDTEPEDNEEERPTRPPTLPAARGGPPEGEG